MDVTPFPTMHPAKAKRIARKLNAALRLDSYQRTVQALTAGDYELLARNTSREPDDIALVAGALADPVPATPETVAAACRLSGHTTSTTVDHPDVGPAVACQVVTTTAILVEVTASTEGGLWTIAEAAFGIYGPVDSDVDGAQLTLADPCDPFAVAVQLEEAAQEALVGFESESRECPSCGALAVHAELYECAGCLEPFETEGNR